MKDFEHPNVLSLIGVVVSEEGLPMFVIPYMERGDLKHLLKNNSMVSIGTIWHLRTLNKSKLQLKSTKTSVIFTYSTVTVA